VSIFAPTARAQDKAQQVIVAAKGGSKKAEKLVGKMASGSSTTAAAAKQVAREEHVSLVAPPLPDGVFNVILADPPWQYQFSETESRAIENQYPTMDLDDIKKLQIPSADDSVLFLWATAPKLEEALQVLNAWGFGYRTCAVWDKEVIGMGYWFRNQHELLLVGVKGNFHPPDPEIRISSVIRQKRSEHSRKPECIYGILESMFPQGKFLELFARQNKRPDWMIWGNQLEG
jgi:N6-adenosine-specific RNA methylase IME4